MNKNRGSAKMMLMMRKMTERRMAMVLEIWEVEGLITVRSLRRREFVKQTSKLVHNRLFLY